MTSGSSVGRSATFRALDLDFVVETDHPALSRYLDEAFRALRVTAAPTHVFTVETHHESQTIAVDGALLSETADPATIVPGLMSAINRAVVDAARAQVLLHASAVERAGRACLFPAAMESGKSTLAAGLVRAGFRYVTDEAVAIDPSTLEVVPYPRPISIDRGSWSVLSDLRPDIPPELVAYFADQWHVSVLSIRPDAVAPRSLPTVVAFPRYDPRRRTVARRVPPARALVGLVESAFNLDRFGDRGFAALAGIVQRADCYQLIVSDLDAAVRTVTRLVQQTTLAGAPAAGVVTELGEAREQPPIERAARAIGLETRLRRRPGVVWITLDRVVVFVPASDACVDLNPTGSLLWQCLDGRASLDDLAVEFAEEFGAPAPEIASALVAMARRLVRLGLVVAE